MAGGARRTDVQDAIDDLQFDGPGPADEACRKTFQAIADLEANARFGRSIGMTDGRIGEARLQAVENGLVRDLARQADIARCNRRIGRAHQGAAPVRWRTCQMRHAMPAQPRQEIRHAFLGIRQDQRGMAQQRPKEDLQTAIPADIIECAPDDAGGRARLNCAAQAFQAVRHQLGGAGGAGGEQHPFALARWGDGRALARQMDLFKANAFTGKPRIVTHHHVNRGTRDDRRQMFRLHVRRHDHDPRGDTVQFDQRQCGKQLVAGAQQDMGAGEIGIQRGAHRRQCHTVLPREQRCRAAAKDRAQTFRPRRHLCRI